jgi:acetyl-CoA acetyltransferase
MGDLRGAALVRYIGRLFTRDNSRDVMVWNLPAARSLATICGGMGQGAATILERV